MISNRISSLPLKSKQMQNNKLQTQFKCLPVVLVKLLSSQHRQHTHILQSCDLLANYYNLHGHKPQKKRLQLGTKQTVFIKLKFRLWNFYHGNHAYIMKTHTEIAYPVQINHNYDRCPPATLINKHTVCSDILSHSNSTQEASSMKKAVCGGKCT